MKVYMDRSLRAHTMFRPFLRLLVVIVFAQGRTEYDPEIGILSNEAPYWSLGRPISIFPQPRNEINTQFFLFTVNNTKDYQVVSVRNLTTFQGSYYDGRRPSVFIIHGYTEKGNDPWLVELCQKILERHDVNCFCVDWSGGSSAIYFQAMNNIQAVGGEIAFFIRITGEKFNSSLSGIHLIGHSLGAQAAGEAGKRCPGIPRITILDAARPCFENESAVVSIDPTDGVLVIGIHTDTGPVGIGMRSLYGHINFFPNGGEKQTGCDGSQIFNLEEASSVPKVFRDVALCNHVTSYYAYISSFHDPSGFMGYCASSYSEFQQGAGFPCSSGSCLGMGYDTDPQNPPDCSIYYLNTGPRSDYPRWRFNVTAKTNGNDSFDGSIAITIYNSTNGSDTREIHSGPIEGGSEYSALIDIPFRPPFPRVSFFWRKSLFSLIPSPTLGVNRVTLISGNDGSQYRFCGGGTAEEGVDQILDPCP